MIEKKYIDFTAKAILYDDIYWDIVDKMLSTDTESFGHYWLEDIDDAECYDWNDEQEDLINEAKIQGADICLLMNSLGDFEQSLGLICIF
jgi:hypothetical protein